MAASAYMLSLLVRQYLFLVDAFRTRYPSSWLIWEPGAWRPARTAAEGDHAATQQATKAPARPVGTDALCFELKNETKGDLTVGRVSESDIFINDMTLSREQLRLSVANNVWSVRLADAGGAETHFDGTPAIAGKPVALKSGSTITAGDVRFTFYDTAGFIARLKAESQAQHAK
ncbi:MAG: FHA domain-containing protein [Archangium sp.]